MPDISKEPNGLVVGLIWLAAIVLLMLFASGGC